MLFWAPLSLNVRFFEFLVEGPFWALIYVYYIEVKSWSLQTLMILQQRTKNLIFWPWSTSCETVVETSHFYHTLILFLPVTLRLTKNYVTILLSIAQHESSVCKRVVRTFLNWEIDKRVNFVSLIKHRIIQAVG